MRGMVPFVTVTLVLVAGYLLFIVTLVSIVLLPKPPNDNAHSPKRAQSKLVQQPCSQNLYKRHRVRSEQPNYLMVFYGHVDDTVVFAAKQHQVVVLYPQWNLRASQVAEIQKGYDPDDTSDDVIVLGYLSIGEDVRTIGKSTKEMARDPRFVGDKTGPRVDPRGPMPDGGPIFGRSKGKPSPAGTAFASFYLDDNSVVNDANHVGDGIPDRNGYFGGAFTNMGDDAWYEVLKNMTLDGEDNVAGIEECLTRNFGRGYGFDGMLLDTADTAAPNQFTDKRDGNQGEFEWTAPGFRYFVERLVREHPDKLLMQNRGLFFFNNKYPHFWYNAAQFIDFLLIESFRLDSRSDRLFDQIGYDDNQFNYAPKIMAEAGRSKFFVFSLGYAEGPPGLMSSTTLLGPCTTGYAELIEVGQSSFLIYCG